jgi:hypothetical protein
VISIITMLIYRSMTKRKDPFNPLYANMVIQYVYALGGGMAVECGHGIPDLRPIDVDILPKYYALCLLGSACFQWGYLLYGRYLRSNALPIAISQDYNTSFRWCLNACAIVTAIICFKSVYAQIIPFVSERYINVVLVRSKIAMDDSTAQLGWYFTERFPLTLILGAATLAMFKSANSITRMAGGVILLCTAISGIIIGFRQALMFNVAIPAIYFHYRVRKFTTKEVTVIAACTYLVITVIPFIRYIDLDQAFSQFCEVVQNDPKTLAPMSGEAAGPTCFFMVMMDDLHTGDFQYQYTRPLTDALWSLVPRIITERPMPVMTEYLWQCAPQVAEVGGGFGTFFIQEPYLAFGIPGVVFFMLLTGMILHFIYHQLIEAHAKSDMHTLIYTVLFYTFCIQFTRSSLFVLPKFILVAIAPFAFAMIVHRLYFKLFHMRKPANIAVNCAYRQ